MSSNDLRSKKQIGVKHTQETIDTVMFLMLEQGNVSEVARQLNLPMSTVHTIYNKNKDKDVYKKSRELYYQKKDEEFIKKTTTLIDTALERLGKELNGKDKINPHYLTTVIGTLYDKRALQRGESTVNTAIHVKMCDKTRELAE